MWDAIHKKIWVVIWIPLLVAGIVFLLTYKKAGQYKSVALVEASIPDQPTKTQTLKDLEDPDQYYENMVATMKTEVITSMVSYRLLLHDLEKEIAFRPPAIQYSDSRRQQIKKLLEKKLAAFELLSENVATEATVAQVIHNMDYDIARWIRDGEMVIERKPESSEIQVITSTEDPFLSAFASNTLSQEYIRYETSVVAPVPANDSIGYYRQEVDRLRKNMEAKTGELNEAAARKSSPADDIRFRRAKADRISEYEMRIVEEESEAASLREELSKLQRSETEEPAAAPVDVAGNAKIQAARKKIDQLSAIYVQGGSKDKKIDSIITVLRKQVNDEAMRIQMASQRSSGDSPLKKQKEMIQSRIDRHEQNIASIRNDIRRLRNTSIAKEGNNEADIAPLRTAQEQASKEYNLALAHLKDLEARSGAVATNGGRASHHLILKSKALPSAETESPWAMWMVIGSFLVTLATCLIVISITKPAPPIPDDIFLRVNYANRQRRPVTNNQ